MITAHELKQKYLEYFASNNHAIIAGHSIVPENDPTVLFTTAGMHPLAPYIIGQPHPAGDRLANCQQCIRTGDIDVVGNPSHLTFFEMLGNWSLGSYFKEEAIRLSFEFLTSPKWLAIPKERLAITVFKGNRYAEKDLESARCWQKMGISEQRIYFLDEQHNWWGPAGATGPCGPDSEMFIDTAPHGSSHGTPESSGSTYFEVWNDVFMQYQKDAEGVFHPLQKKCVDTGMGVERAVTILQKKKSVYETELFMPIISEIEHLSHIQYGSKHETDVSIRIIADHIKAAVMIIADAHDIIPSNIGQGYIVRRLLRRAIRHGLRIGINTNFLQRPARAVINLYAQEYSSLRERSDYIADILHQEESAFNKTLKFGQQMFEKEYTNSEYKTSNMLSGKFAFHLYDTFGFPLELTQELALEKGMTVDVGAFNALFEEHRQKSHGSAHSFKGGLADNSAQTTRLHTATHLLHQALREVLGNHVQQKGSNITPERLRFDFSHPTKLSEQEIAKVEEIVNRQIQRKLSVTKEVLPLREAMQQGAIALFSDKYSEAVSTYRIGDYSFEVCGGPHVTNTEQLHGFKIQKEQSSSHGVRRIRAILINHKDALQ